LLESSFAELSSLSQSRRIRGKPPGPNRRHPGINVEVTMYNCLPYKDNDNENHRPRRKTCVSVILSTTNPTPILLVSDPGLLVERRKTDCLNHGMAFLKPEIHVK